MCIRCETREKARRNLAFPPVYKPHTHITYMLRQCTSIVYVSLSEDLHRIFDERDSFKPIRIIVQKQGTFAC